MAVRQEKIRIPVFGPTTESASTPDGCTRADDALLRLARMIGRQMARDNFELLRDNLDAKARQSG